MRKSVCFLIAIVTVGFLLQGCQKELGPEEKCNFIQNSLQRRVSWSRFPVQFYADQSVDAKTLAALELAMKAWNEKFSSPVFSLIGRTSELTEPGAGAEPPRDTYNSVYVVADDSAFRTSNNSREQARTTVHHRGDFIYEADIVVNGSLEYYLADANIAGQERKIELESLLIHELGHVLGLDHIESEPSVMATKLDYGEVRKEIQDAELDSLSCEYN